MIEKYWVDNSKNRCVKKIENKTIKILTRLKVRNLFNLKNLTKVQNFSII